MIILEWALRLCVAAFGISVGIAATYLSQKSMGADPVSMFITMGIAAGGTVLIVMAHEAWHRGALFTMAVFTVCGLVCSTFAMTASMTGDASIKDAARGLRMTKQTNEELERGRRTDALKRISTLEAQLFSDRTRIGAQTVEILQPTFDALKGCKCPQLVLVKQKMAVAKELAELRRNRDGWQPMTEATVTADPGIEAMTTVAKDLGADIPAQSMRAGLSAWKVVAMEVMAIIIPIGAFAWGRKKRHDDKPVMTMISAPVMPVMEVEKPAMIEAPMTEPKAAHHDHDATPIMTMTEPMMEEPKQPMIALENKAHHGHDAMPVMGQKPVMISEMPAAPEPARHDAHHGHDNGAGHGMTEKPIMVIDKGDMATFQSWRETCADADVDGERTSYKDAYEHYQKWCKPKRAMTKPAFTEALARAGWVEATAEDGRTCYKASKGGTVWLYGMRLRKVAKLRAVK